MTEVRLTKLTELQRRASSSWLQMGGAAARHLPSPLSSEPLLLTHQPAPGLTPPLLLASCAPLCFPCESPLPSEHHCRLPPLPRSPLRFCCPTARRAFSVYGWPTPKSRLSGAACLSRSSRRCRCACLHSCRASPLFAAAPCCADWQVCSAHTHTITWAAWPFDLQEAIRIGDQIRIRRNAELLQATLTAWHLQVCFRPPL